MAAELVQCPAVRGCSSRAVRMEQTRRDKEFKATSCGSKLNRGSDLDFLVKTFRAHS